MAKINGTKENDILDGGVENDVINGLAGDDIIAPGLGNDTITGGVGTNIINVDLKNCKEQGLIFGNDIVNLTKGEKLTLNIIAEEDPTNPNAVNIGNYAIKTNGKDYTIAFYKNSNLIQDANGNYVENTNDIIGSITFKNFAAKDVLGAEGSLIIKVNDFEMDLVKELYTIGSTSFESTLVNYDTIFNNGWVKTGVVKGTRISENINASEYEGIGKKAGKGVTINAGAGNDNITGSKYDDTITGGVGSNTINVSLNGKFGDDTIVLTKNENLVINVSDAGQYGPAFLKQYATTVEGKDFIVKFYAEPRDAESGAYNEESYLGSIRLKDFASKDVVGENGSVVINIPEFGTSFNLTDEIFTIAGVNDERSKMVLYSNDEGITSWLKKGTINGTRLGEDFWAADIKEGYGKNKDKGVTINAGGGDDSATGSNFADKINGGDGDDILDGYKGNDVLNGGNGNDDLCADEGNDTLLGGDGDDILKGGADADVITGGKGKNTIIHFAGGGNDIINLTKGEQLTLEVTGVSELADLEIKLSDNKKDVLVYTSETEYITIKNLGSKDVTNDSSKKKPEDDSTVMIKVNGVEKDLRDYVYNTTVDKNYTGTWLNENIDASGITTAFDKKGIKGVSVKAAIGDDKVTGSDFNDTIYGGDGVDTINGGEGADLIKGDKGEDELYGEAGDDKMYGGDGYDYINGGDGNDLIKGEKGQSWLVGGAGNDTIEGGSDYDYIQGGADADLIKANNGDDYIEGNEGADTIYGGDGSDTIVASTYFTSKPDGVNTVTDYYSHFLADKNAKTIDGGKGNDVIWGSAGADTIKGGDGDDKLYVFGENSVTYAGNGNDLVNLYGNTNKTVYGDKGNDIISIEYGNATVEGGAGNDTIWGGYVSDSDIVFKKGAGHDSYLCRTERDNTGNDTLVFDNISTSALKFNQVGEDLVISYEKNSSVTVLGYYAENSNSSDWNLYVETKDAGKVLLSDMIKSSYGTPKSDKIVTDKEIVYALAGNDKVTLSGNGQVVYAGVGKDTVYGGEGDNEIYGEDGNDVIYGGTGNEYIEGGLGADTIYGGEGNDTIIATTYFAGEVPEGVQTITDYYSKFLSDSNAKTIDTGNGDDRIWGGNGADKINAGAGNDKVYAFGEGSVIDLGDGNDLSNLYQNTAKTLYAGAGNDTVSVEYGKATVTAGAGNDSIWGGYVSDSTYIFAAGDGNDLYRYRGYTTSSGTGTPTYCNDTLVFENVSSADMTFVQDGEKLVITYADNSSVALDNYFKEGSNSDKWNVYLQTTEGKTSLADAIAQYNAQLQSDAPEGAVVGTFANDTLSADKTDAVIYGYQGDDILGVSNDWYLRTDYADGNTKVSLDAGAGNDTLNVGKGTFEVSLTGGEGADFFNISDTWHYDAYTYDGNGTLGVCKGSDITINDFSAEDTIALRNGAINHFLADGYKVSDTSYAKYSMFFDVAVDAEGNATADLSKVMFALDDKDSVVSSYNATTGKLDTSIIIKTADENGSVLDAGKIVFRDTEGNDVEYKFNEVYINDITEKVAAWLSDNNYGSVSEAITAGDTEVLTAFVNASLPNATGPAGGYDIFVPVV